MSYNKDKKSEPQQMELFSQESVALKKIEMFCGAGFANSCASKIRKMERLCRQISFTSSHEQPIIKPYKGEIPHTLCAITRIRDRQDRTVCPHFYMDDAKFEKYWDYPQKYLPILQQYPYVIGPDFSVFYQWPKDLKTINAFRNKLLMAFWQKHGISVIPNVVWDDTRSIEPMIEGLPKHSVIAINSTGLRDYPMSTKLWQEGYEYVLNELQPTHILRYGAKQACEDESISTYYPNDNLILSGHGR